MKIIPIFGRSRPPTTTTTTNSNQQHMPPSPTCTESSETMKTMVLPLILSGLIMSPSLSRAVDMFPLGGTEAGTTTLPNPSGEAARLLLDTPSKAVPMGPTAKAQLRNIQKLQDDRLSQCEQNGKNWEQCFFYGTKPNNVLGGGGREDNVNESEKSPSKIPTW
jgi:hypothetical protein